MDMVALPKVIRNPTRRILGLTWLRHPVEVRKADVTAQLRCAVTNAASNDSFHLTGRRSPSGRAGPSPEWDRRYSAGHAFGAGTIRSVLALPKILLFGFNVPSCYRPRMALLRLYATLVLLLKLPVFGLLDGVKSEDVSVEEMMRRLRSV